MAESRVDILLALKSRLEGDKEALKFLKDLAGGLTVAGAAYAVADLSRRSGELAGEIKPLASEANLTTDAFQALKIGAMGYQLNQETLVRGAVMLRENLQKAAADGASPLNTHLEHLHLTAAGLQALAPERQFEVIGRAIATATDKEQAFGAAMELIGAKNAPKLLEFLQRLGVEGFDKLAASTKSIVLTKEQLDALDKAANSMERMAYSAKILLAMGLNALAGKESANPAAAATQIDILQKRIAAFEAHGLGNDPRVAGYRATLAILQQRLEVTQATEKSAVATAEADEKSKMAAAELAATLKGLEKSGRETGQKIAAFDQKSLNAAIEAVRKKSDEDDKALEKEGERYRNLADPTRAFRLQLEQIELLKQRGILTDLEAAAATKAVTQAEMERSGELGAHAKKLSELQEQRQLVEGNPFLSAAAKQSQLALVLQAENAELDKQIKMLREKASLSPGESRQLEGLVHQRTSNQFNPAGFTPGQEIGAALMAQANSFGTQAHQIAGVITNTIGRSVDAISQGITGWITGTTTWGQVAQQLEAGVLSDIVSAGLHYAEQLVINATLGKSLQAAGAATSVGVAGAAAASISALMIAPATLATIATLGEAALAAPAELAAAMAASAPLGLFYEGGHTGAGGIVHANEWVAPAWMVDDPVLGPVIDGLEASRTGAGGSAAMASAAAGGKPTRFIHVQARDANHARQLARDPEFDNVMIDWAHRNRGAIVA